MKWQHALVLIVLCLTSMTAMCKNPVLKNTRWVAEQQMFVADAGTMTITHTLEFVSATDVVIKTASVMPSHPATYVNADGSIDRIPGWTHEQEEKGTYRFRKKILSITDEDGITLEYKYHPDGTFTIEDRMTGETLVFVCRQD